MEYQNTEIMQCCYENQEQQNSSCIHHSHLIYFPEDCFYLSDTLLEPSLSYNNTMTLGHTMPIDYTTTNLHSQTVCNNKEGLSLSEASSIIEIHSPDIHPVSDMTMTTNTIDLLSSLENTVAQAMTNAEPLRSSMTTIEWNHKDTYQQHVFSIDHPIESCWPQNKIDFYKQDIKDIQEDFPMQSQEEYQVDLNNSREESASSMCDLSNSSNSSHCNTVCFPHSDEDWNSASQKTKEGGQSLNGTFSLKEEAALQDYSFFQLSKEELIQRVVELEREKQLALNKLAGDKLKSPTTILGCNTTQSDGSDEEETYLCRWIGCYFTSTTLNQLITHIKDIHIGSGKAAYYCEWSSCPRKNKPFIKRHKMQNHMRTHTGEKPFECHVEDCDKKFSRLDSLNTHIKTHSNTRPYTCPIENCNKAYFHSRSLRKHAKSHPSSSSSNTTKEFIKNAGSSLSNDPLHIATMIPEKVNIIDPNSSLPIHSKQRQLDDRHPIYQQNNHDLQVSSQEIFVPNFITPVMRGDIQHISPNHLYNGTTNLIGRQQQQQQQTFAAGTAYNNTCIIPSESSFVFHNSQQQPSYDLYLLPSQQMHHSYN